MLVKRRKGPTLQADIVSSIWEVYIARVESSVALVSGLRVATCWIIVVVHIVIWGLGVVVIEVLLHVRDVFLVLSVVVIVVIVIIEVIVIIMIFSSVIVVFSRFSASSLAMSFRMKFSGTHVAIRIIVTLTSPTSTVRSMRISRITLILQTILFCVLRQTYILALRVLIFFLRLGILIFILQLRRNFRNAL